MVYLETERVLLLPFVKGDEGLLLELDSDPEVMRYISRGQPSTRERIFRVMDEFLYWQSVAEGKYGYWKAVDPVTKAFYGWFHLRPLKENRDNFESLELGYRLKKAFWGKGIASEVSKALIEKAFKQLNAQKIYALTMKANLASIQVMKKCGFRFEREELHSVYGKDVLCVRYVKVK